jgi:hypothetical protein
MDEIEKLKLVLKPNPDERYLKTDEVTLQALKKAAKERGVSVEEVLSQALHALKRETEGR